MRNRISSVHAREILDSRGRPTVEVDLFVDGQLAGRGMVPAGASTGTAEVHELRDRDSSRYDGWGVQQAVQQINSAIQPKLFDRDPTAQFEIDDILIQLDPTPQKSQLGGNSLLGVSLAVARAGAQVQQIPLYQHLNTLFQDTFRSSKFAFPGPVAQKLQERERQHQVRPGRQMGESVPNLSPKMPVPMTNMISGGLHAGGNLDFQDFLIMPFGAVSYPRGLEWIVRVYKRLGRVLFDAGFEGRLVGDEGGFGPKLQSNVQALDFLIQAIESAGLRPKTDVTIALDVAATHFLEKSASKPHYRLKTEANLSLTSAGMIERLDQITRQYPVTSIEDGLAEDDWDGWRLLTDRLGENVQIVGDDLFTTNPRRLEKGIENGVANAILIKMNQIGTITETLNTIVLAKKAGYRTVVSARSGETEDDSMADLAVATAADQIKIGSIVRSERLAKYNRLLRIDEELRQRRAATSQLADFNSLD